VFHYPETICVADAFWILPRRHQDGILLHEFGHLLAGPEASEESADAAVEAVTGAKVDFLNSRYGFMLETLFDHSMAPDVEFDRDTGRGSASLGF
jgi:hypothetical protein